jgi:hypothetical protein
MRVVSIGLGDGYSEATVAGRRAVDTAGAPARDYFCGNATFGAGVNGSIPNFGYASLG